MKVYIVTSGSYSDYHIDEVFTDREQAYLYCAARNTAESGYYEVEEYGEGEFARSLRCLILCDTVCINSRKNHKE